MPVLQSLPALGLLVALAACDTAAPPVDDPTPIELSELQTALVVQSNAFGVGLFAEVAAEDEGNLMLSPLSASVVLTMLLNGADGETYSQIRDVLGYGPGTDLGAINAGYGDLRDQLLAADPDVQLALANAVFYDRAYDAAFPFKTPFLDAMRGPFDARVDALDFGDPGSVDVVNGWASDNTDGRVPTVLDEINPDLVLFLLNALYFKGDWTRPFDPDRTAPADFRLASGETVQVPTMSGDLPALLVQGDGYQAAELAYGRGNFSMLLLMPDEGPLADFAADLGAGLWTDATTRLDTAGRGGPDGWGEILVRLPTFTFEYEKELNGPLKALGMEDAFVRGVADLSRMGDDPRLYVDFVKQNTFVEVNEEGTEAAAVTTGGVGVTSLPPSFVADRPFVFAIRERTTNTLLFIGQLADPRG